MVFSSNSYFIVLVAWIVTTQFAVAQNPAFVPIDDNPELPRVLILGDSISIGYTLPLRAELKNEANVHRPPENCASTREGLENLDKWLEDGEWDVIHFNFGLHDLKYINADGNNVSPKVGKQKTPLDEYVIKLEQLTIRIKATGAAVIWCATTPVPKGTSFRISGDAAKYNNAAAKIMKKHGVPIDDLYTAVISQKIQRTSPNNVHFTADGSMQLARVVANEIRNALKTTKEH
jgi:acyl-CoA thioesterase-1